MGTIVKAFKELKDSVKALEDKVDKTQNQEVKEIMENQKMLEDLLKANSEAIRKIDSDIIRIQNENFANQKKEEENSKERLKKCKFFNSGHCKYKVKCKFSHPSETCQIYLEGGKCDRKLCEHKHPKVCKWLQGESGSR